MKSVATAESGIKPQSQDCKQAPATRQVGACVFARKYWTIVCCLPPALMQGLYSGISFEAHDNFQFYPDALIVGVVTSLAPALVAVGCLSPRGIWNVNGSIFLSVFPLAMLVNAAVTWLRYDASQTGITLQYLYWLAPASIALPLGLLFLSSTRLWTYVLGTVMYLVFKLWLLSLGDTIGPEWCELVGRIAPAIGSSDYVFVVGAF